MRNGSLENRSHRNPIDPILSKGGGRGFAGPLIIIAALLFFSSSCGYHLSGTGGVIPQGARSIAILTFVNGTNEPYVDTEVTSAVANEFIFDGRLKVTDRDAADLLLSGRVVLYDAVPLAYNAEAFVQTYQVRLVADVTLEDRRTGNIIRQINRIDTALIASYPVTLGDIKATRAAKDASIKSASKTLAGTIRSRILEGF